MILVQFVYEGDTKARQLGRRKCTACYRAGKQAKATDQATADDEVLAGIDLPALVGSQRQVDWANKIRRERLAAAMRKDAEMAERYIGHCDAKWWIDYREQPLG